MPENRYQPDFIMTIGGTDVTRYVERWELQDLEDAISSLTATIVNDNYRFSGKFNDQDKMVLRFGYQGNMGPKVTLEVKEYHELYTDRGLRVIVVGRDPAHRLVGATARGQFNDPSIKKAIEEIGEMERLKVIGMNDLKDPRLPPGFSIPLMNKRLDAAMRWLMQRLSTGKPTSGGGNVPRSGSPKKPIKAQPKPKKGSFHGVVFNGTGARLAGGVAYDAIEDQANNLTRNVLQQRVDAAASVSIRGFVELIGVPMLRAKKCLTILNVGPEFSGKWYAAGVAHEWDVHHGYHTRADLLRDALGKDGEGGTPDQPIIMHADIYQEDTLFVGKREIDGASQATFTFGQDDKLIRAFKASVLIQDSKAAGEGSNAKRLFIDAAIPDAGTSQIIPGESPGSGNAAPQEHNPNVPPL